MTSLISRSEGVFDIKTSDVFKFFMGIVMIMVMTDIITRLLRPTDTAFTQYIQSQSYAGVTDPRTCDATYVSQCLDLVNNEPYTPWVSADFINDGPDSVWVAINGPDAAFEIKIGESAVEVMNISFGNHLFSEHQHKALNALKHVVIECLRSFFNKWKEMVRDLPGFFFFCHFEQ